MASGKVPESLDDLKKPIDHIEKLKNIMENFYFTNFFYLPIPGTESFNEYTNSGGVVPLTLEEYGIGLWNKPVVNKLHWLQEKERKQYMKLYNEYFLVTKAKKRTEWHHKK